MIVVALFAIVAVAIIAGLAASFIRFVAELFAEANHVPAPHSGFDRAGGPGNGHSAPHWRQRSGAAAAADHTTAKDGNGASHSEAATA